MKWSSEVKFQKSSDLNGKETRSVSLLYKSDVGHVVEVIDDGSRGYSIKVTGGGLTDALIEMTAESVVQTINLDQVYVGTNMRSKLDQRVAELYWSVRTENCFERDEIQWVGQLVQKSERELLQIRNLGYRSLNEVKRVLAEMGLSLGMKIEGWEPPVTPAT